MEAKAKVALSMVTDYQTYRNPSMFTKSEQIEQIWPLYNFWVNTLWTDDLSQLPQINCFTFDSCFVIAKARKQYFRDKYYSKGESRGHKLLQPVENVVVNITNSGQRNNRKALSRFRFAVRNLIADIIKKRTSIPYPRLKAAWPQTIPQRLGNLGLRDEVRISHDLNVIFRDLGVREAGVKETRRWEFITPTVSAVGIQNASDVLATLFPNWGEMHSQPTLNPDLILMLHTVGELQARQYIIALACIGAWRSTFAWDRMTSLLAQGAWPWLAGYNKVYAKIIFSLMATICAAVDMGIFSNLKPEVMDNLAACLIPRHLGWPWKLRTNQRLTAEKVKISAVPAINDASESGENGGASQANQLETSKPWTPAPFNQPPETSLRNHIIIGSRCNHGPDLIWAGRVLVAHSMQEVVTRLANTNEITVALTRGDEIARREVETYSITEKIVSVKRHDEQCISCACKLAHVVSALLVIV